MAKISDIIRSCCQVESIISLDDKGQMVLPKEVRAKAGIEPGDKLAVITWEKDGKVFMTCPPENGHWTMEVIWTDKGYLCLIPGEDEPTHRMPIHWREGHEPELA